MKKGWLYNIILSDDKWKRVQRHLLFWLAVYIYQVMRISIFYPPDKLWTGMPAILKMSLVWGSLFLTYFTYTFVYYLVPRFYNRKKYFLFGSGVFLLILSLVLMAITYNYFNIAGQVSSFIGMKIGFTGFLQTYRPALIRILGNPPLICGFFLALKTMKSWYKEQMQNDLLARENANAELQLLKAQVHPHFLFNTLNNIYSFTLNQSPEAPALVNKLSDTLQYMITDCKTDWVPLQKEIKMLEDYIGLEKVRYGERLEMWIDIQGDADNKLIAPLIMIPFVENCFKHGTSMMRGKQWMQLNISIKENRLHFRLTNSKPPEPVQQKNKKGIGLQNVKKRLALLYPGKHQLDIGSADGVFSVHLQLALKTAEEKTSALKNYAVTYL